MTHIPGARPVDPDTEARRLAERRAVLIMDEICQVHGADGHPVRARVTITASEPQPLTWALQIQITDAIFAAWRAAHEAAGSGPAA